MGSHFGRVGLFRYPRKFSVAALLAVAVVAVAGTEAPSLAQLRSGMPDPQGEGTLPQASDDAQTNKQARPIPDSRAPQKNVNAPPTKPATAKGEGKAAAGKFDGTWTITFVSTTCEVKGGSYALTVAGQSVRGGTRPGSILPSGAINWSRPALGSGGAVAWSGTFSGNAGSGTFSRDDGRCGGTFTAAKRS